MYALLDKFIQKRKLTKRERDKKWRSEAKWRIPRIRRPEEKKESDRV